MWFFGNKSQGGTDNVIISAPTTVPVTTTTSSSSTESITGSTTPDDNNNNNYLCQLKCPMEQKTLVACVDSIRASREVVDSGHATSTPTCLLPAVEAWTKCCAEANGDMSF